VNRFLIVILITLLSPQVHATSMMNIGPLAKIKSVTIEEITVGEPLTREGVHVRGLFDEVPSDVPKFRESLTRHLQKQLSSAGIEVAPGAGTSLMVAVYGGKYQQGIDVPNFFLIQISVVSDGDCGSQPWITKLGLATDQDLARTLEEVIVEQVDAFLEERARYLETLPKPRG